ncbi:MAG: hypothetical protein ABW023_08515 [Sphingomonas sp.]
MVNFVARTAGIFAAATLAVSALPAIAAADPSAPAPAVVKAAKDPSYCVKSAVTGTRLNRAMVCKKRSEWIAETGVDPAAK